VHTRSGFRLIVCRAHSIGLQGPTAHHEHSLNFQLPTDNRAHHLFSPVAPCVCPHRNNLSSFGFFVCRSSSVPHTPKASDPHELEGRGVILRAESDRETLTQSLSEGLPEGKGAAVARAGRVQGSTAELVGQPRGAQGYDKGDSHLPCSSPILRVWGGSSGSSAVDSDEDEAGGGVGELDGSGLGGADAAVGVGSCVAGLDSKTDSQLAQLPPPGVIQKGSWGSSVPQVCVCVCVFVCVCVQVWVGLCVYMCICVDV